MTKYINAPVTHDFNNSKVIYKTIGESLQSKVPLNMLIINDRLLDDDNTVIIDRSTLGDSVNLKLHSDMNNMVFRSWPSYDVRQLNLHFSKLRSIMFNDFSLNSMRTEDGKLIIESVEGLELRISADEFQLEHLEISNPRS